MQKQQTSTWDKYKTAVNEHRNCKVMCKFCEKYIAITNRVRHHICKGSDMAKSLRNGDTNDAEDGNQICDYDVGL